MKRVAVFMCLYLVTSCNSQDELFEGATCMLDESLGICTNIRDCRSALEGLRKEKRPKICTFSGTDPIVCCLDKEVTTQVEEVTKVQWMTSPTAPDTTTLPAAVLDVTLDQRRLLGKDRPAGTDDGGVELSSKPPVKICPPISLNKTAEKTGQKAWDKCIEYQERLVLPCDASRGTRLNKCRHDLNLWILNGEDAYEGEFPHMALVGYGSDPQELSFLCGGSLISDQFVLTAGHCISSRDAGPISYVMLGVLNKTQHDKSNLHRVRTVYKHPGYEPPKKYNDLALLQLDKPVKLTDQIMPACLDVAIGSQAAVATATGWGTTEFRGQSAEILQKVDLSVFTEQECAARYPPTRLLHEGFNRNSQLCYGDRKKAKDTCQGDSGGPLQVQHERIYCMYNVVGITSFGRACGVPGEPALYTRVAAYVPWLEATVWPDA